MRLAGWSAELRRWHPILLGLLSIVHAAGALAADSVAKRIHERLDAATAQSMPDRAVAAFYAQRDYAPAWQEPRRYAALVNAIDGLRGDGLDPADYALSAAAQPRDVLDSGSIDQRADLDLRATQAYLLAIGHLRRGKVDPRGIDPQYNFEPTATEEAQWLRSDTDAIEHIDIDVVFARARPRHPAYARLQDALQRLRGIEAAGGWPAIPDGPTLQPGDIDTRVTLLRRRLQLGGYLANAVDDPAFGPELEIALREFQAEQYLDVDGRLGPQTRAALNRPVEARIDQVRVNLERARWLLREAQGDFVLVDIAGFKVTYFKAGTPLWSARAQVGLPYRSTPSFKSEIDAVTFNPTWTVPPTILSKDLLPKIRANPGLLARNNLRVLDASGQELAASAVDWSNPRGIVLRQDAGADNSLGRVAIRFPNPYGVYMHDTPHKELFAEERRAFSSGCIRVERPLELVAYLFAGTPGWDREKIDGLVAAGETKTVRLPHPVAVLLLYWSVDTHDGERITFKPDIYGKDAAVLRELNRPLRDMHDL